VNDYIEYDEQYSYKVTAVDGDKLTVAHGAETIEMTKSEFINLMSVKSIKNGMESQITSLPVAKASMGSLKFDENKTIDGVAFKIYHASYTEEAEQEATAGISFTFKVNGNVKFFVDDKGIVQLIRMSVDDVSFDLSNVPSDQKEALETYLEIMEASMKGEVEDNALSTNLAFVEEIPISV